jgi:predicted dehydrogenase
MSESLDRRSFLGSTAAGGLAWGFSAQSWAAEDAPAQRLRVGVMGLSRGAALARQFAQRPGVEVAYVCDVDRQRVERLAGSLTETTGTTPQMVSDFRRILDDDDVDALVVAATNHWHAPAAILACSAGKHVYVEKPGSHNPGESEMIVAAARKYDRKVQVGFQRRSWPVLHEAMQRLRDGAIGEIRLVRGWYNSLRGPLAPSQPADVPEGLDWDLWQGPAPRVPYRTGLVPYNWHWFWHWGNGELGNNGSHGLDLCLWGLGMTRHPQQVSSGGGIYFLEDTQETPDSQTVTYDYGDLMVTWEGRSAHLRGFEGSRFGAAFFGTKGTLTIPGNGYAIYEMRDKLIEEKNGPGSDTPHVENFLAAIRDDVPLNGEIETCQRSTMLCHLGSIAHRVGRTLHCDPQTGRIQDDPAAMKLWARDYEPGWKPQV